VPQIAPSLAAVLCPCLTACGLLGLWRPCGLQRTMGCGCFHAHPKTIKDLGSYVCGMHLGNRGLHMKIIGGRTSNLYVLIMKQMDS
jgi:hypothetical protein